MLNRSPSVWLGGDLELKLNTPAGAAEAYAAAQLRVLPLYGMSAAGPAPACSCHRGESCPNPGVHPLEGYSDDAARVDSALLGSKFNLGVGLGASKLVALQYGPEVPPALHGLLDVLLDAAPPTIVSDAHSWGVALYREPAGDPSWRGQLAPGLTLLGGADVVPLPPSVTRDGRLRWGELPLLEPPPPPLSLTDIRKHVEHMLGGAARTSVEAPPPVPIRAFGSIKPMVVRMSDVDPVDVAWLWPGYLPYGAVTILQSHPGTWKSTISIDLAMRVTTGAPPPLGEAPLEKGTVLLVGREDGLAHTVRPRLDAAGADSTRVFNLSDVRDEGIQRGFALPDDLQILEAVCTAHDVRLVIIDPIVAHLAAGHHALTDHGVRRALDPLAQLAQKLDIAVVLVRHLVKSGKGPTMHHGSGSIGLAAIARSVLHVEPHAEGAIIRSVKSSLGPKPDPVLFRLEPVGHHARVEWLGTADAEAPTTAPTTKLARARMLLAEWLADGPVPTADLKQRAQAEEISWRTMENAKRELRAVAERQGPRSAWRLRNTAEPVEECGAADLTDGAEEVV